MMTPEKPMSGVTVQELDQMIDELYDAEMEYNAAQAAADEVKARLDNQKLKVLGVLNDHNKTSYKTGRGMVVRARKFQVNFPKDAKDKAALRKWLEEKKAFSGLWSINHMSLNAWYNAELDAAKQRGDGELEIPGLGEPKFHDVLQMRKR